MRLSFISLLLSSSNTLVYSIICCYHECFVCSVCILPQASNYHIGLSSSSTALNCQRELFSFLFKALFVSLSCSLSFLFFVVVSDTPFSFPVLSLCFLNFHWQRVHTHRKNTPSRMSLFGSVGAASTSAAQTNTTGDISKDVALNSPPEDSISDLRFSPASEHLAVASWDKKVRIYEINEQGQSEGKALFEHEAPVLSCCWAPVCFLPRASISNVLMRLFCIGWNQGCRRRCR